MACSKYRSISVSISGSRPKRRGTARKKYIEDRAGRFVTDEVTEIKSFEQRQKFGRASRPRKHHGISTDVEHRTSRGRRVNWSTVPRSGAGIELEPRKLFSPFLSNGERNGAPIFILCSEKKKKKIKLGRHFVVLSSRKFNNNFPARAPNERNRWWSDRD